MRRTNEVLSSLLAELVRGVVDVIRFFYIPPGVKGKCLDQKIKEKSWKILPGSSQPLCGLIICLVGI
jgi:hypothetical protein